MLIDLLRTDPVAFVLIAAVLTLSLVLHELGHALAALWAGDDTARRAGRVTLNPLAHLDPMGTLLLLFAGLGWAKPVPIYPPNFRRYRTGLFVVSIAGIVINLTLALGFALLLRSVFQTDPEAVARALLYREVTGWAGLVALTSFYAGLINLILALFNLLPIPPLDGSKILQSLLPLRWHALLWRLERYSLVSFVLILADLQLNGPISRFLGWAQRSFIGWTLG